jgi:hypothetical protein
MKRCPQCEFIYEDDQSRCDMDGQGLLPDHGLSVMQSPQESQVRRAKTFSLNGIVLPAGAGVLLALAIFIGYTVSPSPLQTKTESASSQTAPEQTDHSLKQNSLSMQSAGSISGFEPALPDPSDTVTITTPEPKATLNKATHAHLQKSEERFPIARSVPPLPRLRPLPRLPEAKPLEKKPNPNGMRRTGQSTQSKSATTVKKDSKVGSFFKKTGRVLTKPFRL